MKIEYIKGDILTSDETVIVHGCNAQGAFASGFAGAIRKKHPFVYDAYMKSHQNGRLILGAVVWATNPTLSVANAITQERYGKDGKVYVSYDAIRVAMEMLNFSGEEGIPFSAHKHGFKRIAMPMIGAGLGGGDWNKIEKIIETAMTDVKPVVYTLE